MDYNNIAVALLATVAGLRTFSAGRAVFYREAASGLNRCAVARRRWPVGTYAAAAHDLMDSFMVGMAATPCRNEVEVVDRVLYSAYLPSVFLVLVQR